jgi:hypothetical protein
MSLPELFDRLRTLEVEFAKLETKITVGALVLGTCGVLFWGITSWFIYDKLDDINASMDSVDELQIRVSTNELRHAHQEGFNTSVVEQLQEQKAQIDRLSYNSHTSSR